MAQTPSFEDAGTIKSNGSEINIGHGCPCVVDWNGDGSNDLLMGQFASNSVIHFENTGTNSDPALQSPTNLQAGGSNISVSTG
jgi:hypothetical protein